MSSYNTTVIFTEVAHPGDYLKLTYDARGHWLAEVAVLATRWPTLPDVPAVAMCRFEAGEEGYVNLKTGAVFRTNSGGEGR